jgi:hypothetical protein
VKLKGQEQAIWNAVYAAATVDLEHVGTQLGLGESVRTERAIDLADTAVRRLRERRASGRREAGQRVD